MCIIAPRVHKEAHISLRTNQDIREVAKRATCMWSCAQCVSCHNEHSDEVQQAAIQGFEATAITKRFVLCNEVAHERKPSVHQIPCDIWLRLHEAVVVEAH